jgi:hypothetical protein
MATAKPAQRLTDQPPTNHAQGTYTPKFDSFLRQVQKAVASISLDKLGIGLETINESENNRPLTDQEWEQRCERLSFPLPPLQF